MTLAMSLHKRMSIATGHQAVVDGQMCIETPRTTCSAATVATPRHCLVVLAQVWSCNAYVLVVVIYICDVIVLVVV